ncbi:MAG: DUF6502 family protein [Pseudomonadota bacterium]
MSSVDAEPFRRILKGLIRPLVRTLIARGVTAPAFYRLLKTVYVEVAEKDFRIDDAQPTDSRITLLTGVHRRDVRAILSDPDDSWETARSKTATIATVLGQWMARNGYRDENGTPIPLPRTSEAGPSFEALVQGISRDIRARTVLDEVLRQELVIEDADGMLRIADGALAGPGSPDHKAVFFAANVGDHMAAAAENLLSDPPPFYERAVFYNRLSTASVDQIEARARELAQAALEELNTESSALQQADRALEDGLERYRFGLYFYRESANAPNDPSEGGDRESD